MTKQNYLFITPLKVLFIHFASESWSESVARGAPLFGCNGMFREPAAESPSPSPLRQMSPCNSASDVCWNHRVLHKVYFHRLQKTHEAS